MKTKTLFLALMLLATTLSHSQSIANTDLIGEWYGPNSTTLYLNSNGTGEMEMSTLDCSMKMVSWSATASTLNITWNMAPIQCTDPNTGDPYTHAPKIEFDKPQYTITITNASASGIATKTFSMTLNNKEYNSIATYIKVEVEETDE
jgi:hypothetical protein